MTDSLRARLASVLPGRRAARHAPRAARLDVALAQHEHERHHTLLAQTGQATTATTTGGDGFLPAAEAARLLGLTLGELADEVGRGLHEQRQRAGQPFVRPNIVSVLAVRQRP